MYFVSHFLTDCDMIGPALFSDHIYLANVDR
jgi:hypothetical protein